METSCAGECASIVIVPASSVHDVEEQHIVFDSPSPTATNQHRSAPPMSTYTIAMRTGDKLAQAPAAGAAQTLHERVLLQMFGTAGVSPVLWLVDPVNHSHAPYQINVTDVYHTSSIASIGRIHTIELAHITPADMPVAWMPAAIQVFILYNIILIVYVYVYCI